MDQSSILEKIQKCLAMAEHPRSNPTEAATALRMAQALMRQHGISEGMLKAAQVYEKTLKAATQQRTEWETSLARTIGEAFGVHRWWKTGGGENPDWGFADMGDWGYAGHPSNVEIAAYAHVVLRRILQQQRQEFVAGLPPSLSRGEKTRRAESFVAGFLETVAAACEPLKMDEGMREAVAIWREKKGFQVRRWTGVRAGDSGAAAAGREAGKGVSLHRPMHGRENLKLGN